MKKVEKRDFADVPRGRDRAAEYATPEDFCSHFENEMQELYSLSLALTADHAKAEECFVAALEDCRHAKVFKKWERSWSRLAIIDSAIRIVQPKLERSANTLGESAKVPKGVNVDVAPVMRLNPFHRFVFVLSVLDRYSVRDCAVLLKCAWQEVERARRRSFEFFAAATPQMNVAAMMAAHARQSA